MIIAIDTRFLNADKTNTGKHIFLKGLTEKYPQDQFLYIFDRPFGDEFVFPKNVNTVVAGPKTNNQVTLLYWLNYKLPALLKKHKADVFVGINGVCSLRTKLPQCLVVDEIFFFLQAESLKRPGFRFAKKYTPGFVAKATQIITVSEFSKSVLMNSYKIETGKVDVVYGFADEIFKPMNLQEKEEIRQTYSDGKDFFLFISDDNSRGNHINLLKAFSVFKKRQKSSMLLLIAGKPGEEFIKDLRSYKFRDEVKLFEDIAVDNLAKLTAAAYCLVYPAFSDNHAIIPLQAMQCEIPVIVSNIGSLTEICTDAALYIDPESYEEIAAKMMLIYKDEHRAKELIHAGKIRSGQFTKDRTIDLFYQSILKACNG